MFRTIFLTLAIFCLLPIASQAGDVGAIETPAGNGCKWIKLCEADTQATGNCARGADDIIANYQRDYSHTLYADQSAAGTTFSGKICSASTVSTSVCGATSPLIVITDSNNVVPFDAVLFAYWIELTANDDEVTIWDYACPLGIGS